MLIITDTKIVLGELSFCNSYMHGPCGNTNDFHIRCNKNTILI